MTDEEMKTYKREWYRRAHGVTATRLPMTASPVERFEFYCCYAGDCIVWTGASRAGGYGNFYVDGKTVTAHRWIYEQKHGPVLPTLKLDHLCRNHICVNDGHLDPVTNQENVLRGICGAVNAARQRGLTACKRGHEFNEANTYIKPNGNRGCRACRSGTAKINSETNA